MTEIGRASGPQRKRRKQAGAPPPAEVQEAPRRASDRTEDQPRYDQYRALTARSFEQVELMLTRFEEMPAPEELRGPPTDEQLGLLMDIEKRVTSLRVDLDQVGCAL